jgi:hypothetical protein
VHGSPTALRGVGKGDSNGGALEGRREEEEEEEELTAATAADRGAALWHTLHDRTNRSLGSFHRAAAL